MLNEMKTLMIVNPAAQSGHGELAGLRAEKLLRKQLGENLDVFRTTAPRHAIELAAQLGGAYDWVIALGGDGVIHEAAGGLMAIPQEDRPLFGIIPVGSGNDYAKTLGMSTKVEEAVNQLFAAKETLVDVGVCNGEYFVETLSFGLDAGIALDTVERRKTTNKTGALLYAQSGIDQLLHHLDTYTFTCQIDGGEPFSDDVKLFACQIGQTYGGGFRICPEADISDGIFDLCYAKSPLPLPKAAFLFAKAKDGKHVGAKQIVFKNAKKLHLEFDHRPPVQMDGEAHIADAYDIECIQHALRVLKAQ